ncbi:hypothetical protein [Limosilactobacillus reuteri]|uniref:hypothetical protein n=1 Tax=Limosilactobacillus reuteri TaxID=1598 RepID=UPI000A3268E3|nr:hypothetical protein [Limosilactobacillus reuteri]
MVSIIYLSPVANLFLKFRNFKFYSHAHLGFWLDKHQFYDGKTLIVKGVLENERLEIKFVN